MMKKRPINKKYRMERNPFLLLSGSCDDPEYQQEIVDLHNISASDFSLMTDNFFYDSVPEPKLYKADEITAKLADASCATDKVVIFCDEYDHRNNVDIRFTVTPIASDPTPGNVRTVSGVHAENVGLSADYSVTLFMGLLRIYEPEEFWFYKCYEIGSDGVAVPSVTYKVLKNKAVVYIGNMSGFP
jgi:hypothetical protein